MGERYQVELVSGRREHARYEIMDTAARPSRVVATARGMPDARLVASALNASVDVAMPIAAQ